jgi:hypothetical protein
VGSIYICLFSGAALPELRQEGIQRLKDKGLSRLADGTVEWEEKDGLVWHRGKLYIPEDDILRRDVVHSCHDTLTVGHPGEQGTLELVRCKFWWPGMTVFVQKYVRSCDTCNRIKSTRTTTRGALNPHEVPEGPWKIWSTDHIVELPESDGYNAILVAQDYSTKQAHFVACTTQMTAEEEADAHVDHIFKLHGLPSRIVLDRGSLYTGKVMRAIYKRLGIKANYSTAFHPQTDGQTERVNQELETYLQAFCNQRQDNWSRLLPIAEFAYNSRIHSATKKAPFELLYRYNPDFSIPIGTSQLPTVDAHLDTLKEARAEADAALTMSRELMAWNASQGARRFPGWKVGDKVWLDAQNLKQGRPSQKLSDKKLGPFTIKCVITDALFELQLPQSMKVHPVFNMVYLTKAHEDPIPGREHVPSKPVIVEGEEEYKVEDILDSYVQTTTAVPYQVERILHPSQLLGTCKKCCKRPKPG